MHYAVVILVRNEIHCLAENALSWPNIIAVLHTFFNCTTNIGDAIRFNNTLLKAMREKRLSLIDEKV